MIARLLMLPYAYFIHSAAQCGALLCCAGSLAAAEFFRPMLGPQHPNPTGAMAPGIDIVQFAGRELDKRLGEHI